MIDHNFANRLRAGERLIGTMITLESAVTIELLSSIGFDWLFIDTEHSPLSAAAIQNLLQAAGPATPCLVRLSTADEIKIKKALDVGATGIIAPMVNSAEQAQKIVSYAKYPPQGTRGVGIGRAHGYGRNFRQYLDEANENTVVVIQAEHIEAVENIEAIVQVPGIDAVFIGPNDLSASLGRMGEVDHPLVVNAIDKVTAVCQSANIPLGIFGATPAALQPYLSRGYTLLLAATDTLLLGQSAAQLLSQLAHIP
jgi:2-keto-3-deoxy-L-rhamnonate aldolase RhmA